MTLNTFTPQVSIGTVGGNVPVYLDNRCTQRAQVFTAAGLPQPNNALSVPEGGVPPVFQCSATTVYFKHDNGNVVSLTSSGTTTVSTISGAPLPNVTLVPKGF